MHNLKPNAIGMSLAPFLLRSNRHSPVYLSVLIACCDSLSLAGCINMQTIPSVILPVFKNVGFYGLNLVTTG